MNLLCETIALDEASQCSEWDRWTCEWDGSSVFMSSWWLGTAVTAKTFRGNSVRMLVLRDASNGNPQIAFVVATRRIGHLAVVMAPFQTPYLGPMMPVNGDESACSRTSRIKMGHAEVARALRSAGLIVLYPLSWVWQDTQPYQWAGAQARVAYTYLLPLASLDGVWRGMDATRRRNIQHAERLGLAPRIAGADAIPDLMRMESLSLSRSGVLRKRTWDGSNAARLLGEACARDQGFVVLVRDREGTPVAACGIVHNHKQAHYLLAGAAEHASSAPSLCVWAAIQQCHALGLRSFDFEGSMVPGIEAFFRKFGGTLTPRYVITSAAAEAVLGLRRAFRCRKRD